MAWDDRILEAAYTAPDGTRIVFDYEDVSRSVDKRTTAYEFPDADGTYVQDLGRSGRKYPLRIFLWGADYDQQAQAFEDLLTQRGAGRLEHPAYGSVDVVPFGTITRNDALKTAANQAVIEVTFWETITAVYPSSQTDPASEVLAAVGAFNAAIAADLDTPSPSTFSALIATATAGLSAIASAQDAVRKQFDAIADSINSSIDTLVADPLTLGFQTVQLIQAPARAAAAIADRLAAYRNLAASIIALDGTPRDLRSRDLFATAYVTGAVRSALNNQFETRTAALAAAEELLAQFDAVNDWRDGAYNAADVVDTGEAYQQLQEAVALAAGYLVQISFSLKQERTLVLPRDRTMVDLVFELYGSVDDQLDFFIASNDLTGTELLELPRGRACVYYV